MNVAGAKLGAVVMMAISMMLARCTGAVSSSVTSTKTTTAIHVTALLQVRITPTAVAGGAGDLWLLGTYPCATGTCSAMMRSTDGGNTFVRVSYPSTSPPFEATGQSFWFGNAEDGYLYVSSSSTHGLYWTRNGGKSWRNIQPGGSRAWRDAPVSGPLASPIVTTDGRAYVLVLEGCSTDSCKSVVLASSPVTSDTWTTKPVPVNEATSSAGLAAFGSKVWLIVTLDGGSPAHVLVSENDGQSFSTLPSKGMLGLCSAIATSPTTLWGFCITGNAGYAVRSTYGGRIFKYLPGTTSPNASNILPVSDDEVIFQDETSTHLRLTRDGGASFSSVLSNVYGGCAVAFASKTTWLVLGLFGQNHPMWRTTNGGRTWQPVKVPRV
jgi:photosystem II stability/assembly factor-like uncharacterized protein